MKHYEKYLTKEYLMGPNCLRLLRELVEKAPDAVQGRVLDMGCGCALTSLYAARETKARQVFAMDLWISAADNWKRIQDWGMEHSMIPIHADASQMPFAEEFFDTIISLDAYHYFGREKGYFQQNVLPLLKKGGYALLAVPGIRKEWEGDVPPIMQEWAGDEWDYFHSCPWWHSLLQEGYEDVMEVKVWEAACHEAAWQDWFNSGHAYALADKACMDKGLKEHTNFVMILIRKK